MCFKRNYSNLLIIENIVSNKYCFVVIQLVVYFKRSQFVLDDDFITSHCGRGFLFANSNSKAIF